MRLRTILTPFPLAAVPLFLGCQDSHDHDHGEGEGHDHDGADHDEGETHAHDDDSAHSHDAHAEGTHGGHIYVLGDDAARAELAHTDGKLSVWTTTHEGDPVDAGESVRLQLFSDGKSVDFTLKKTAEGASELADRTTRDLLEKTEDLEGRLHATIDGKKVTGVMEHHAHE